MREARLTIPQIALIGATRGMLGAGAALLLGNRLEPEARKAVGWTLFLIGAISTIPLALDVFGRARPDSAEVSAEREIAVGITAD